MLRIATGFTLVLLPLLTGCLEVEATVKIAPDGSGTQALVLHCADSIVQTVKSSAGAAAPGAADPLSLFDKEAVTKELTPLGLGLTNHVHREERGRHELTIGVSFPSPTQLAQSPLFGGESTWTFLTGAAKGQVELVVYPRGRVAHEEGKVRLEKLAEQDAEMLASFFEKRKRQLAGLALTLVVELPGDVVSCSANWKKTGARQVTATVGEADIRTMQDLVSLLAPRFTVTFDARECKLPVVAREPELADKKRPAGGSSER